MRIIILVGAIACATYGPVAAQEVEAPLPLPVQLRSEGNAILPAGTEIQLRMNETITTSGNTWQEGDTFNLVVAEDVMLGQYIVIPAGTPAVGRITWLTSRGMFGKSGKMDVELEHIEIHGRQIAINGTYRQEGEGATLETLGGVLVAGVFGGIVTGRSARIPNGRELRATTEAPIELAIAASEIDYDHQASTSEILERGRPDAVSVRRTPGVHPSAALVQQRREYDEALETARQESAGQVELAPEGE
ncbi:hypothetical protein OZN62_06850 [Aurantiacibacter sp. MUD11]|uniref:hypothetical protein n=1 Tax=Aurantiacibacter sp. MUD11 TaxID=3003265 RepID=UPI0022AAA275|nr:hypothetical protein [Aurantiacibacter sp. MUD11]WAT19276.1 hypothetical protein OZN62_06850 [Aurantiacibacter sp. MUD11]